MSAAAIASRIEALLGGAEAERVLRKYYEPGRYTGAAFDSSDLASDPERLEMADLVAPATLSAELSGRSVVGLLTGRDEIDSLIAALPGPDTTLVDVEVEALEPLWSIQTLLNKIPGVGPVRRSKLLAHKRPHLIPIRDQHVLAALGLAQSASFTLPLRDALRTSTAARKRLDELTGLDGLPSISQLRALDVVLWMRQWGDRQVPDS